MRGRIPRPSNSQSPGTARCSSVRDQGKGFDQEGPRRAESYGLLTMRERVESLGGSFRLSSVPGAGTEIEVRVPIDEEPGGSQKDEKQQAGRDQGPYR